MQSDGFVRWCVILLGGGGGGGGEGGRERGGGMQQLGWDLKPILGGLKLEDYRTNILCKNCAQARRCHCFCEREQDIYCPHRSSAPVLITKGWHKFTSSLSPSNKTVTVKRCAPVSMKQPFRCSILVRDNSKEQKRKKPSSSSSHTQTHTQTHVQAPTGQNFIQAILERTQICSRIWVTSDHSVK